MNSLEAMAFHKAIKDAYAASRFKGDPELEFVGQLHARGYTIVMDEDVKATLVDTPDRPNAKGEEVIRTATALLEGKRQEGRV